MADETPKENSWLKRLAPVGQTLNKAGDMAFDLARRGAGATLDLAQKAAETSQTALGKAQRKLGEDYHAILDDNPLVRDTLSRADLLRTNRELLATAYNIPWTSTLLWSTAAGSAVCLEQPINRLLQGLLHDGPGHWKRWDEVNRFMDNVRGEFMPGAVGSGHRLKFGHSIEYLPQIVERFGIESTPAFFVHLLQDAATVDGIPVVPKAWDVRQALKSVGLPRKVATGLVSLNYSSILAALAVVTLVAELWKLGEAVRLKAKTQNSLQLAAAAFEHKDYLGAVENYQRALEVQRSPVVLMALGQVYMQRAANRLRAHEAFKEAVVRLADQPDTTVSYHHAKLSLRGLAGLQALATADVLAEIHPEHWNDHVSDLVNATMFSFVSTASKQAMESDGLFAEKVFTSAHFSAAINYYLAAKAASFCPFLEEQRERVRQNMQAALGSLGLMAQYDEDKLRHSAGLLGELWQWELLLSAEMKTDLVVA